MEAWNSTTVKHPSFFLVTQVLSIFESLLSFAPALILGILELDLLASEVHVLSMSEPLFSFCFLEQSLSFLLKMKTCNGIYNGGEIGNGKSIKVMFEHPVINRTPKQLGTIKFLQEKRIRTHRGLNDERTLPQAVKFAMFAFILSS